MAKRDLFADDITLDEESHTYHVNGYEHLNWGSSTEFIHHFFHGFDAEKVAEDLSGGDSKRYGHMSQEEILDKWDDLADEGTRVHWELENYIDRVIMGKESEDSDSVPITHHKTEHGIAWLKEHIKPHFQLYTEVKIYSLPLQIAGTIDLLIYDPETDRWIMADWKTNRRIYESSYGNEMGTHRATMFLEDCNYNHYQLQMSLYQWILKQEYDVDIYKRVLLHLREKQTSYYPLGVKAYWTDYLKANISKMVKVRRNEIRKGDKTLKLKLKKDN